MADIELIETVTLHGCCRPVPLDLVQLLVISAFDRGRRKVKFTDGESERLRRQSSILSSAVAELVKILADHPQANVREYRLAKLFEVVGSSAFIASHVIDNPTLNRMRTAATNAARSAEKEETKRSIAKEWANISRSDYLTDEAIAGLIQKKICKDLETGTITKYMRELRAENSSD
jgi:hypothetical protein